MSRIVIQTPVTSELRREAENAAIEQGYSSLQDAIRMYLKKLAQREIKVQLQEQFPPVQLSAKAIKRYDKMTEDYKNGKNIFVAENVEDLMDQLNGIKDPVPFKVSKTLPRKNISKQRIRRSLQRSKRIIYA